MNSGNLGFFGGATPGIIYILWTMLRLKRVMIKAVALARERGEFLDFDSSENQNLDYLLSPGKFIKPGDGPGVRQGKELLLAVRSDVLRRYWIGVILLVVGAILGVVIASGIDTFVARP